MVRFRFLKQKEIQESPPTELPRQETVISGKEYYETLLTQDRTVSEGHMMLSQYGLSPKEKTTVEKNILKEYHGGDLREQKWEKTSKEDLGEIRALIDHNVFKKSRETVPGKPNKEEYSPPVEPLSEEKIVPELIQGTIIDKEIIYETPGGYIVKVTYQNKDDIESSYYSVSKIHDVQHALDNLRSYTPTITTKTTKTMETMETPELQEEKIKEGFFKKTMARLRV